MNTDRLRTLKWKILTVGAVVLAFVVPVFAQTAIRNRALAPVSVTSAASVAVTAAARNTIYIATLGGGATQTFTLPAASTAGLRYCFICGHDGGEILVNPAVAGTDNFVGKVTGDGAALATVAGTGIKNTAATNVTGDYACVVSNGVTTWYMDSHAGTWASQ